jgi:hypothetical protein
MGSTLKAQEKIFVTHTDISGVYSVLVDAVLMHFRDMRGNVSFRHYSMRLKRIDYYLLLSLYRVICSYMGSILSQKAFPYYIFRVGSINFGQYVTASVLTDPRTQTSSLRFFLSYHVSLARAIVVFAGALREQNNVVGIFLGDTQYLDGIWIDYFLKQKDVAVYLKLHPHNIICVSKTFSSLLDFQQSLGSHSRNPGSFAIRQAELSMENRLKEPNSAMYDFDVEPVAKRPAVNDSARKKVVIYAHSFTDAQLDFGFDGFRGVYDWLTFTVDVLGELGDRCDVYLKAHPIFYAPENASLKGSLDREMWLKLIKSLPNSVKVVDYPISNFDFLQEFSPVTDVLISHHSNALVEGAYLGFNVVSSIASPWFQNYSFSISWTSKDEYRDLLLRLDSLKAPTGEQKQSAISFIIDQYQKVKGDYSECFFMRVISRHTGISVTQINRDPYCVRPLQKERHQRMVRELSKCVDVI